MSLAGTGLSGFSGAKRALAVTIVGICVALWSVPASADPPPGVLEHGQDDQPITWSNSESGSRHEAVPTKTTHQPDGRHCREYTTTGVIGGKTQTIHGRACRQPDGTWKLND